jgi:RimJ/RimL family protein N-acetyltransferase
VPAIALPELRDDDLRLRLPLAADVPALVRACRDPDIQRWTQVPAGYTEEDARSFALMATGAVAEGTGVHLLVTPAVGPPEALLGCVGLTLAGDVAAEVGYWVPPWARGQGIAARATRMLCRAAFDHLGVPVVHLLAATANLPSQRVAVAAGFRAVGTLRSGLPDRAPDAAPGARLDAVLYDLLPCDLTPDGVTGSLTG